MEEEEEQLVFHKVEVADLELDLVDRIPLELQHLVREILVQLEEVGLPMLLAAVAEKVVQEELIVEVLVVMVVLVLD